MLFREHRAGLSQSMETVVSFENKTDLIHVINSRYPELSPVALDDVEARPYGFDGRLGWNTHIVIVRGQAVGFTDATV
ncbi:hypothetical protein ABCW43_00125 [Neorhizobium sp. IRAMC:178]|uniref:hypothetical protein n=1 Tax=Neorhizobium tunisiense TaxID=3144793 RepID=UPI0031F689D1